MLGTNVEWLFICARVCTLYSTPSLIWNTRLKKAKTHLSHERNIKIALSSSGVEESVVGSLQVVEEYEAWPGEVTEDYCAISFH